MSLHSIPPETSIEILFEKAYSYIPKLREITGYEHLEVNLSRHSSELEFPILYSATVMHTPESHYNSLEDIIYDDMEAKDSNTIAPVLRSLIKEIEKYIEEKG